MFSPFKELPPTPVQGTGQEQTNLLAILPSKPHPKAVVLEAVLGAVLAHESQPPHLPSADLERGSSQMYFKLRGVHPQFRWAPLQRLLSSSGEGFGDRHRHRGRRSLQTSGLGSERVTSRLWHFVAALIKMLTFANCVCRTQTRAGSSNVTESEVTAHMCRQGWQEAEQPQRPVPAGASPPRAASVVSAPLHMPFLRSRLASAFPVWISRLSRRLP